LLEEDLEIANDFFEYFDATYPLLRKDRTIMTISAWNDNGEPQFVNDPTRIFRTEFFPGLGWLCTRALWHGMY
jgi:alpha-1,3-mannosyl-glycoprotein beta-1,2-N-acetylglucosaminyltransferase